MMTSSEFRQIREQLGLTQEELAVDLDCSIQWLSRVETRGENLTLQTLEKLADALGVEVTDLLVPPDATTAKVRRGRPPAEG